MTRKIPLSDIWIGVKLALQTSFQKLSDAELLISKGSCENAVILIQFALEEFGKAVFLKEKLEKGMKRLKTTFSRIMHTRRIEPGLSFQVT